jgi:MFS family permease
MQHRRLIMAFAVLSQIAISLIQFGLPALTFALRDQLGFGPFAFGILFAATGVGPALALIAAGRLCDVVGARPVLIAGSVIGACGLFATAAVHDLWAMCATLTISGIGSAGVPVAGMTAIIGNFPPNRRGLLLGMRQMAVPAGGFVAAGLLPLLNHAGGLALAFTVAGAFQLVTGLGFAVVVGPSPPLADRIAPPSLRSAFSPALWWLMVTGGLYVCALGGVLAFTVSAAHNAGLSTAQAATVFAALNLGAACARIVWGIVSDRAGGSRRVATLSLLGLLGAASAALFPFAVRGGVVPAAIAAVALAFGTLGFNGVVYTIAGEVAGRSAGVAVGATATVIFLLGSAVGPAYGALVQSAGYGAMFVVIIIVCLAGSFAARRIGNATPAQAYTAA